MAKTGNNPKCYQQVYRQTVLYAYNGVLLSNRTDTVLTMSLKYLCQKRPNKRGPTIGFHSQKFLENTNIDRVGTRGWRKETKGHMQTLWQLGIRVISIVVMPSLIQTDVRASQILCHSFHLSPNFVRLVFTNGKLDPSPPWNVFFEGLIRQKS